MSSNTKLIVIVVVLVTVLAVSSFVIFLAYTPTSFSMITNPQPVTITDLTLAIIYPNYPAQNGYFGNSYRFLSYSPIYLQKGQTYQTAFTLYLPSNETSHTIDKLTLGVTGTGNFQIFSTNPNPPITATNGTSTTMSVTLQAPNTNYNGPVTIDLFTH